MMPAMTDTRRVHCLVGRLFFIIFLFDLFLCFHYWGVLIKMIFAFYKSSNFFGNHLPLKSLNLLIICSSSIL